MKVAPIFYPVSNGHQTQEEAQKAARKHLAKLEETQPTETSGGQEFGVGDGGIQDSVYIIHPSGRKTRFR